MIRAQWHADAVCTIDGFLTVDECDALIARSEAVGFDEALVSTREGAVRNERLRNNDRAILDDEELSTGFWQRLQPHLPPVFHRIWHACGLNERLRFYRYDVGQQFDWHCDGNFWRSQQEESHFTFMIYLNND